MEDPWGHLEQYWELSGTYHKNLSPFLKCGGCLLVQATSDQSAGQLDKRTAAQGHEAPKSPEAQFFSCYFKV
jgi:hypothetical protein